MDKEEKKIAKQDKPKFDRTRLLTYFAYVAIFAVIFIVSLYNVGFDLTKIADNPAKFVSDLLILYALTIVLLYLAINDGENTYMTNPFGAFMTTLKQLSAKVDEMLRYCLSFAFTQYVKTKHNEKRNLYLASLLSKQGLEAYGISILDLRYSELEELQKRPIIVKDDKGVEHGYDIITREQYDEIIRLKRGKYTFKEMTASFITNEYNSSSNDEYQWMIESDMHIKLFKTKSIVYRLMMLAITSAMFAAAFINPGSAAAQIWVNAVSRLADAVMAITFGYVIASTVAKMRTGVVGYKLRYIQNFFSDYRSNVFCPKDITDNVKEKLANIQADEDKKALAKGEVPSAYGVKQAVIDTKPSNDDIMAQADALLAHANKK